MKYIRTFRVTVLANAIGQALGVLTPEEGYQYHIIGLSYSIAGAGQINAYMDRDWRYALQHELLADGDNPLPIDDVVPSGMTLAFLGTDTSGAPNLMLVEVIYEKTKVGT